MKKTIFLVLVTFYALHAFAQIVPASHPFYAGDEQTDDRIIYVGGGDSGGRLAIDCHSDFSVARDDNNVALNWSNLGTFKWTFGFFSFDGPISEYPSFNSNVGGSTAVTFDGDDKLRMILEPGFGYTLPSEITDGVLSIELWVMNPSVETGETLIRFEDVSNVDLTASQFNMSGSTSWQHLVAVSNGTETSYYLNGSHVATQAGAINFSGNAVINLGAQSFSGSIAAVRIHTEQMNTNSISHNYDGGVGLGTYLFYPIEAEWQHSCFDFHGDANIYTGDPTACDLISWRESAHFRSMWWHDDPENNETDTEEEIGDEIEALQLPELEAMYTYLNEKSGKHLPHVSNNVLNRGDGRKYKWIVGNTWGGGGSGWSILELGHGAMYITTVNPHEYIHGTDNHQSTHVTSQWFETHANFQVSWLGDAQVNPLDACPEDAHIYPSYGGNYYHDYLIWDHLVETPEFTGLYVTRMWNRGDAAGRYPPQNMEDMDPSPDTPFNEEWVKCAAKNITWDYDNHPEYAENWASQENKAHRHFTLLEPVPYLSAGWYEPQKWRAPQQHGYNLCVLEPNQGTITADLTGHIDSERGSAWSAMFVAVDNGTPRYGDVFTNGTQGSFNVLSGDDELYLVVVATPSNIMEIGIFSDPFDDYITDYRGDNKARFPYQVLLGGTTPRPDQWRLTPGTDPSATVDATAYVSPNAYVGPEAQILGNARVEDYAIVYGTVRDNAVVSDYAIVENSAIIRDDARVTDFARIESSTILENAAHVMEHARVSSDRQISDNAVIKGSANNMGNISGTAIIDGNYLKNGDHSLGYQFLWAWGDYLGDGEWYQEFNQLYLEYQFEQQNGYRVWDTYGATWGRLINGPSYVSDNGSIALELDGTNDFVDLHQSVGQFETVSFDVDVKWDGGANGQKLINFSNSANGDEAWLSPSDSQGKLAFSITIDGVTQKVTASDPLPSGSWKNVKLVMYGDTVTILVDDIEVASSSSITHDIEEINANECYIGRGATGDNFDGRIDNFSIWTKALVENIPQEPNPVSNCQTIELPLGWSMFSTFIHPENPSIDTVLSSVVNQLVIVKDVEGNAYLPEYSFNGIGLMEIGQGFQAKSTELVSFELCGERLNPEEHPINLTEGWNIIAYLRDEPANAGSVFSDINESGNLLIVKDYIGNAYLPDWNFNGIGDMVAGEAYQLKVNNADVLQYLSNNDSYRMSATEITENNVSDFVKLAPTDNNMTVVIEDAAWDVLPTKGAEIAAYDNQGNMVGSVAYTKPVTVLSVWGDDGLTTTKEGLSVMEDVSFKLWNTNTTQRFTIDKWEEGSSFYQANTINIASSIVTNSTIENTSNRTLVRIVNLLGQEVNMDVDEFEVGVLFEIYNDGTIEKVIR